MFYNISKYLLTIKISKKFIKYNALYHNNYKEIYTH